MRLYLPNSASSYQVSTGNFATVNDSLTAGPNSQPYTPLGTTVDDLDSSGRILMYRYVKLTSTAKPALIVGPVYYTDDTQTIVTPVSTEGLGLNFVAGVLLNTSATYANGVWIQVYGKVAAMAIVALTAIGDAIIGAAGNQQTGRVAANTAPTNTPLGIALTAVAGGKSDILVTVGLGGLI